MKGASRASKILLWIATTMVVAFAAFPYYSGALLQASSQNAPVEANHAVASSSEQTVIISVNGMTCGSCAASVQLALDKVNGVQSAAVSYENKEAGVSYDATLVTPEQLKAAIESLGFKVTRINESSEK